MTTTSKIIASIAVVFVFLLLSAALQAGSEPGGRNPGFLGIIFFVGLIIGLITIWRKSKM